MAGSPYDDPEPRGFRVVVATLRIVVAVQCWGVAAAILKGDAAGPLQEFLTATAGLDATSAGTWLVRAAWGLIAAGLVTLVRPFWPVLIVVFLWFAFSTAATFQVTRAWGVPAENAVRDIVPVVLLLLDFWPPRLGFSLGRANVALFLLRFTAAVTFIGYGLNIAQQSRTGGPFVEQITGSVSNVLHQTMTAEQAQAALGILGGVAIGLGLGLLLARSRSLALLTSACGAVAAVSHVLAHGPTSYPAVLSAAAPVGAPFTLFLFWWLAIQEQPPIVRPADG